ncbi:hypothetical protein pb186bvf_010558 [Paramecium bursaria]
MKREIYDIDLTEPTKYQRQLEYLDINGLNIKTEFVVHYNQKPFNKQQYNSPSIFKLKHSNLFESKVLHLPQIIIQPKQFIDEKRNPQKYRKYLKSNKIPAIFNQQINYFTK